MPAFTAVESRLIDRYTALIAQGNSGQLDGGRVARALETEILPEWRTMHRRFAALHGLPAEQQKVAALLLRYMDARERAWAATAASFRSGAPADQEVAAAANREAAAAVGELNALSEKNAH
jgi:hypothetical protein